MHASPHLLVAFLILFTRRIVLGREPVPGANAALITKGEIRRLALVARDLFRQVKGAADQIVRFEFRVAGRVELGPSIQLGPLPRNVCENAALDAREVADQQAMPGSGADHGAGDVADRLQRLRIELGDVRKIAGRNRRALAVDVLAIAFEILRLRPASGPASGTRTMKLQGAAHPAIVIAPIAQGVDLGRRRMRGSHP
jgi:hypothetical protein